MTELQPTTVAATSIRIKIAKLNALSRESYRSNPHYAIEQATEALKLATKIGDRRSVAHAESILGACHLMLADYPAALTHSSAAYRLFNELNEEGEDMALLLLNIGYAHMRQGKYEKALDSFRKSLDMPGSANDKVRRAKTLSDIGDVYTEMGDYVSALDNLHQSLQLRQEMETTDGTGSLLNSIANLYFNIGEIDKAHEFYLKGLQWFRDASDAAMEAVVLGNLGLIYRVQGDYATAIDHQQQSLALCRSLGNREGETRAFVNLGDIYEQMGELDEAIGYLEQASALAEAIGDRRAYAAAQGTYGSIFMQQGKVAECIAMLERALDVAESTGNRQILYELHQILSEAYEKADKLGKALEHYKIYTQTKEEIQGQATQRTMDDMQRRVEMERAEKEREIYRLKTMQLELEVQHKTREMTASALHLIQKNELLSKLAQRINQIQQAVGPAQSDMLRELRREIETSIGSEEDWDALEHQFNQIHQDFIRNLSLRYPTLSPAELKVCSLLKMNLSTKEVARLLCISSRSAENHRYHIRQKLSLPADVNLTTFFASL